MIPADVHTVEYNAIIWGKRPSGAIDAAMGRMLGARNARELPYRIAMRKMGKTPVGSVEAYHISNNADASSPHIAICEMRLRLNRSATVPVMNTSSAMGRNSANPRNPRSNSRRVMSYTCFASVVTCNESPTYSNTLAPMYAPTDGARRI